MKIKVNLKYCYGISSLEKEFDFSNKKVFSIYASNGIMKTSFAKTFMDLSKGQDSKDEIYHTRETTREVKKNDSDLLQDEIFVIKPYDQEYKSDQINKLLVNQDLKKKFDDEYKQIRENKAAFLQKINKLSGLSEDLIEEEISNVFYHGEKKKFFESLNRIKDEVLNDVEPKYQNIQYGNVFNDKTKGVIEQKDFLNNIDKYVEKYNELLDKSVFFKKGVFNHIQASDIAKELEKKGFFNAEHSVILKGQSEKIKTKGELETIIDNEKKKIIEDENLKKEFDNLDKILKKNQNIQNFREYLSSNPQIVAELLNPNTFKSKLWISYLKETKEEFEKLILNYAQSKKTIEKIREQAKKEEGNWYKVIDEFNNKFFVPFSLQVSNQVDVILEDETLPNITFKFDEENVEESKLFEVLSQGEKKALYILNILFEIEVRKESTSDTFFVIDDIADSFDYKNKYAIIEYLKKISEVNNFYFIILTHNFDFYRSISSRLDMERKNKLVAIKSGNEIRLTEERYQDNPFVDWIKHLDQHNKLLASIPMVRNLLQYSGRNEDFDMMTRFLHIKDKGGEKTPNTKELTTKDLQGLYARFFKNDKITSKIDTEKKFYELLNEICEKINNNDDDRLENKIVLSMGIRLKAEDFMINQINDTNLLQNINKHQTSELFKKYKENFSDKSIKILERVNLMTPENIHLNSFMYEPILDMSIDELKQLYKDISNLK